MDLQLEITLPERYHPPLGKVHQTMFLAIKHGRIGNTEKRITSLGQSNIQ